MPSSQNFVALVGVDFTSRPRTAKPITVAPGRFDADAVRLQRIDSYAGFDAFAQWLGNPGEWVGAFDFPFGLPRELVDQLKWPTTWASLVRHVAGLSRAELRATFAQFCDARPVGGKFAHRATDRPAGSSPSMQWVNPPVAYMLHAGAPLLLAAGVDVPGLHLGDARRVALEGYPGLLAREILGRRPYKSDVRAKQTPERLLARKDLIDALEQGRTRLGLRLRLTHSQRDSLVADASGDRLDAVLCLLQAAWASRAARWGLPERVDPVEGWITSAPF